MPENVTQILNRIENGDPQAANQLLPLVYEELRKLATSRMSRESAGQTLQPTALVHEAFIRLVGNDAGHEWDNRGDFFAAAAEAMRRILIDNARKRNSLKQGGDKARHDIRSEDAVLNPDDSETLLALDEALTRLAAADPELARMVELRYFTGLTIEETAKVLGVSPRTTKRNWAYARAWLKREMDGGDEEL